ncbi:hypothetical protein FPY71_07075 [Aureimonas fodinaquatilis]|uniref:Uncharacterized protein n=1 Tax=Aureimonas fodinaquatilis TaxID=2565783 RepID=A0A5B0DWU2_9HYPH|nr:hypothetical protein [Aureimonas fodinaquatilis]KAA0970281.1 hypothetical protein FPY71_07075 [Aureimonas fodinaquatilis]
MTRREFTREVRAKIVDRARNADGFVVCEGCGLVLKKKPYQIDHTIPDAMHRDKSKPLKPDDGKLLGQACCHAPKTKKDVADIARAKRLEAKFDGFQTDKKSALSKPEGFKFDWGRGRYVKTSRETQP